MSGAIKQKVFIGVIRIMVLYATIVCKFTQYIKVNQLDRPSFFSNYVGVPIGNLY